MSPFKINDLPEWIKKTHQSQNNWRSKNWEKTLSDHKDELEDVLRKINILNIWSNQLHVNQSAEQLIPEIFIDAYMSLHMACFGLYKYAHACLRSQIETSLRLVYFYKHPVEYKWWCEGSRWYIESLQQTDVWGKGYVYFQYLKNINEFDNLCDDNHKLINTKMGIPRIHRELSKFIHSGAGYLQSRSDRISPEYNEEKFRTWLERIKKIQTFINILFILCFSEEFTTMGISDRRNIFNIGIEDTYYIPKLDGMGFNAN